VIAEFTDKYEREQMNPKERLGFIRAKSPLLPWDDAMAETAGRIRAQRRMKVKGQALPAHPIQSLSSKQWLYKVTGLECVDGRVFCGRRPKEARRSWRYLLAMGAIGYADIHKIRYNATGQHHNI